MISVYVWGFNPSLSVGVAAIIESENLQFMTAEFTPFPPQRGVYWVLQLFCAIAGVKA